MSRWYEWLNMLVGLLVIVNPLLAVSAFSTLSGDDDPARRRNTGRHAAITVAVVLTVSALAGEAVLGFFGIRLPEFQVGGGILILLMALSMLNARPGPARHTAEEADEAQEKAQIGVVPLGIPLLAGPGAISTAIIYAHQARGWVDVAVLLIAVWLVAALVWLSMRLGDELVRRMGVLGLNIATRIMGLLLAAIAVGFVTQGLRTLLPGLA
ncbi:NAAT family transporter [Azoarcus sp. TTM-91]|uniref:UPF0056 membrane protein n=1 Tax=Azoarcus indigens TaxID=29545 RepID=A0A4R6DS56_9RHOO|nr:MULTISPECIES: MarC family protein [Azoarcus]NMG37136.1 NAAT family transporter [Azoarcus sp. TTM-91]NMG66974.1 NAAT family transporter [Azoarcus indigens]TDN47424.1 multiple antibiotic resistance protein [Azoarcus indigens]